MNKRALMMISVLGQFLSVFPFVVLCEGVGFGSYIWWHYPALYGCFALFYVWGRLCAMWALSGKHSRWFRPKAIFISRIAVIVPLLCFIIICASFELSTGLYLYALPAALIMFFGGYATKGKDYADVFTRGWFALYFVVALVSMAIIWFIKEDSIVSSGSFQLCFAFGALIIIAAVLTNQTNIDICTHQRDSGRNVLPQGLRSYNSFLVAAVVSVTVALFLFARPCAELIYSVVRQLIAWILAMLQNREIESPDDTLDFGPSEGHLAVDTGDNTLGNLTTVLLFIGLIVLIIVFRRQIISFFRDLIAPLFRANDIQDDVGYKDEISDISDHSRIYTSRRKREQLLYKLYRKEEEPTRKYRLGYRLMLLRLSDTAFPPVETDNTTDHRIKGENGLRSDKIDRIVKIYNEVRYSELIPSHEDIAFEEKFIDEIRR